MIVEGHDLHQWRNKMVSSVYLHELIQTEIDPIQDIIEKAKHGAQTFDDFLRTAFAIYHTEYPLRNEETNFFIFATLVKRCEDCWKEQEEP